MTYSPPLSQGTHSRAISEPVNVFVLFAYVITNRVIIYDGDNNKRANKRVNWRILLTQRSPSRALAKRLFSTPSEKCSTRGTGRENIRALPSGPKARKRINSKKNRCAHFVHNLAVEIYAELMDFSVCDVMNSIIQTQ